MSLDKFIQDYYPGGCQAVFIFCCQKCEKVVMSFAKRKVNAQNDALAMGWSKQNDLWVCPDCTEGGAP